MQFPPLRCCVRECNAPRPIVRLAPDIEDESLCGNAQHQNLASMVAPGQRVPTATRRILQMAPHDAVGDLPVKNFPRHCDPMVTAYTDIWQQRLACHVGKDVNCHGKACLAKQSSELVCPDHHETATSWDCGYCRCRLSTEKTRDRTILRGIRLSFRTFWVLSGEHR